MKHCNPHAPPFVALLVAILAVIVLPAFADSAGPPGVVTNDAQYTPAVPDTGQSFVIDNPAGNIIVSTGATANVESCTSFVIASANSLVTDYGAVYVNLGLVANDVAPPGQLAGLENSIVVPTPAETYQEAHGDAILHGIASQAHAITAYDPGVDYPLLC